MSEAKQRTLNLTMSASAQSLPLDGRVLTPEMTAEALNTFRGPQGPKGDDGFIKFEELTDEQRELLRGPRGFDGPAGPEGPMGPTGPAGEPGKDAPQDAFTPSNPPTAEQVGALPANGTAANANQLNGKDAKYYLSVRNLLDNSNFEIAQAGYSGLHGTKTYACDRWEQYTETAIEKVDAGLKIAKNSTGSISSIWQYFNINKQVYMRKILTLAVKVDGELYAGSVEVIETTSAEANVIQGNGFTAVIKITASGDKSYVEITPLSTTPVIVQWAAIYEGEYTADNLPPYVPKGYAVELAECMRYAVDVENAVLSGVVTENGVCEAFLPLNVSMRKDANPTVTIKNALVAYTADGNNHTLTFTQALVRNTGFLLIFSCGSTINAAVNIPTFNAFISADL